MDLSKHVLKLSLFFEQNGLLNTKCCSSIELSAKKFFILNMNLLY